MQTRQLDCNSTDRESEREGVSTVFLHRKKRAVSLEQQAYNRSQAFSERAYGHAAYLEARLPRLEASS